MFDSVRRGAWRRYSLTGAQLSVHFVHTFTQRVKVSAGMRIHFHWRCQPTAFISRSSLARNNS